MGKKIDANIMPLMAILLMLISTSQVSCDLDQKCFRDCIPSCFQNPGCYISCGKECSHNSPNNSLIKGFGSKLLSSVEPVTTTMAMPVDTSRKVLGGEKINIDVCIKRNCKGGVCWCCRDAPDGCWLQQQGCEENCPKKYSKALP
ncbi:PREDICTED: uncharacterized protein LOC109228349 [Nicotiana attenuata]|uniref:Uncharacterized protein n=1 Tax=Nicotiana attenuata TaxID=49451 RepID=A0A1J6IE69_NICAT|nr:PREDICTED: uncharacterized protein LOC109228349 [Nicotiana attenuata]OIT02692.1 hypothetical protein A4A49_05620 [Nicotiana attenuata]